MDRKEYIDDMKAEHLTKDNLISLCRYYKGEKENEYAEEKSMFWSYEKAWVNFMLNDETGREYYNLISEYDAYGLSDFDKDDSTPKSLKALLFNRYSHWLRPDIKGFKEWYKSSYMQNRSN